MQKSYLCTSKLKLIVFKKQQVLQAVNTDHFNPLAPKSHDSNCQNIPSPLHIKPAKANWRIIIFCTLGTNGLKK